MLKNKITDLSYCSYFFGANTKTFYTIYTLEKNILNAHKYLSIENQSIFRRFELVIIGENISSHVCPFDVSVDDKIN